MDKAEGRSPGAESSGNFAPKAIEFLSVQLIGAIVAVTFPSSRGSAGLNSSAGALVYSLMTVKRLAGPLGQVVARSTEEPDPGPLVYGVNPGPPGLGPGTPTGFPLGLNCCAQAGAEKARRHTLPRRSEVVSLL